MRWDPSRDVSPRVLLVCFTSPCFVAVVGLKNEAQNGYGNRISNIYMALVLCGGCSSCRNSEGSTGHDVCITCPVVKSYGLPINPGRFVLLCKIQDSHISSTMVFPYTLAVSAATWPLTLAAPPQTDAPKSSGKSTRSPRS